MARPVWTGSISFGLVNVPVKAYTAVRDHDVHFHQLEKKSGARIRNRKVSEKSGKEVDADDIEMGFEIRKGRYVTFDKNELEELRPASTRTIEVTDFVALDEIDPIYYERTYWLAPDGDAAKKAYDLLLAAMEERGRVAIGTVVMRNKQYLTAVRPLDGVLAMSTMRFADEVVPRAEVDGLPNRRAKPDAKALKMATQLVDVAGRRLGAEPLPRHLRRRAAQAHQGAGQGQGDRREGAKPAPEAKVLDLMAALERSVEASKARKTAGKPTAKKRPTQGPQERVAKAAAEGDREEVGRRSGATKTGDVAKKTTGKKKAPRSARHLPRQAGLHRHVRARRAPAAPAADGHRFVVQRHRARRLHYDLRLEADGVLVSWAVPKGPTLDPDVKRMAVHVEDHPLEYFDFEGVIPRGRVRRRRRDRVGLGHLVAGRRRGSALAAVEAGDLHFDLDGEKLRGRFVLVRRGRGDGKEQWLLLHKHDDDRRRRLGSRGPPAVGEDRPHQRRGARPRRRRRWSSTSLWAGPTPDELAALDALGKAGAVAARRAHAEADQPRQGAVPGRADRIRR